MIDTTALKTSIIDLAVSGKISSRFQPSDSVSEIIPALPKVSGKRKNLLGQAFEYGNRPEIPSHWKWICLGEIASYGDTPTKAYFDDVGGDTWILDLEDIKSGGILLAKNRVLGKRFAGDKTVFKAGQVLYSKLRPYLKKVLVADEDGISTPELISFDTFGGILPQYIVYCLLSSFTNRAIDKRSYGIKMPRVDAGFMVNLPIPLPPVSEQHFIVERVQSAISALDTIDTLQAKYADNLAVLKSKLIDAAIQGKLTEQLPEDGTAEDLYRQIQAEKQALIKSGKIKKEKPLPEITADEVPFEIPKSWKWVRLGLISSQITDGEHKTPHRVSSFCGYYLLSARNVTNGAIKLDHVDYVDEKEYEIISKRCNPKRNDVLISCSGSIGRCCVVEDDNKYVMVRSAAMVSLIKVHPKWVMYCIHSTALQKQISNKAKATAQANLFQEPIKCLVIPLPPLAEQKRIVAKLEELLPLCERLK